VKPVRNVPAGTDFTAVVAFQSEVAELRRRTAALGAEIGRIGDDLRHMRAAIVAAPKADPALFRQLDEVNAAVAGLTRRLFGDPVRGRLNESAAPSIAGRVGSAMSSFETRLMPTATQRRDAELARTELEALSRDHETLRSGPLAKLRAALDAAGAPWTPRR
jgi:uncharacterized small protein (DUF1192 family)